MSIGLWREHEDAYLYSNVRMIFSSSSDFTAEILITCKVIILWRIVLTMACDIKGYYPSTKVHGIQYNI